MLTRCRGTRRKPGKLIDNESLECEKLCLGEKHTALTNFAAFGDFSKPAQNQHKLANNEGQPVGLTLW
jgi:hypothetical protein